MIMVGFGTLLGNFHSSSHHTFVRHFVRSFGFVGLFTKLLVITKSSCYNQVFHSTLNQAHEGGKLLNNFPIHKSRKMCCKKDSKEISRYESFKKNEKKSWSLQATNTALFLSLPQRFMCEWVCVWERERERPRQSAW
jgi:hypothetical protein